MWYQIRDFLITKLAGKLLMAMALLGIVVNVAYDHIVTRPYGSATFGYMQMIAFVGFVFVGFVGYVLNDYMKDL